MRQGEQVTRADAKGRLGNRIRGLRIAHEMTQEDLASAAEIHVTYLSGVEHGKRNPSFEILYSIARSLKVSLSQLFEEV